jgi:hypothetical protein
MKRVLVTLAILAICFVLLPWGCYRLIWPTYTWNQKLTLTVETPDGEVSGSGVVRVAWSDSPDLFGDAPHWHSEVHGEATVVDLGDGKYLFALIGGAERLALRVFHEGRFPQDTDGLAPIIRTVAAQKRGTARRVSPEAMPLLVTFADIADPRTVARVDPDDLAATFGPGYVLKSVTLKITGEPVTEGEVERVLPWLETVGRERPTLIPNPPRLRRDAIDPDIQYLTPGSFSTELYR